MKGKRGDINSVDEWQVRMILHGLKRKIEEKRKKE